MSEYPGSHSHTLPPSLLSLSPSPFSHTSGVALFSGTSSIPRRNGLEADNQHQIGNISCHSASRQPNIGRWISPTGDDITTNDVFSVVPHSGHFPSYTVLSLQPGSNYGNCLCGGENELQRNSPSITLYNVGVVCNVGVAYL